MAGRKAGGSTGDGDGSSSPAMGDVATELSDLRHSVDQLGQGLAQLLDATATHTELLSALLAAVTAPTDPEHQVARLLEQLVARLGEQGAQMRTIGTAMAALPAEVGAAVAGQVTAALALVR